MKISMVKIAGMAGLLLAVQAVSADVLYWKVMGTAEVGPDDARESLFDHLGGMEDLKVKVAYGTMEDGTFASQGNLQVLTFDEVNKAYVESGKYDTPFVDDREDWGISEAAGPLWAQLADNMESLYYQIQIYSGDSLEVISDAESYADIAQYTNGNDYYGQWTNPWTGKNYAAVPEPSAGVLALLGSMLLGLKRKQEVA